MKYNEIVERHAPRLGLKNLATGEPCKPFVYMDYVDDGMWVHYVTYCENIRRQKRKRCLAMARYYEEEVRDSIGYMSRCGGGYDAYVNARIDKMKKRLKTWRELADKFKEDV